MTIRTLPKVELHVHLDCSLSYDVVKKLRPEVSEESYRQSFIAPPRCFDLADFLSCAPNGIQLMQNERALRLSVEDLFAQFSAENVVYAEFRFAPLQHVIEGLRPEEVVEIVSDATVQCTGKTGIPAGIILCTLRHFNKSQSLQTVKLVDRYLNFSPAVGFDIAGDEAGYGLVEHLEAFEYAIRRNIPTTAHAGEARSYVSIWETIKRLQPVRLGHGVRSIKNPELVSYLARHQVHLEVCPTCNIRTGIYNKLSDHPIDKLYKAGVSIGINTDARTLVHTTLTDEYQKLSDVFGWDLDEFRKCNLGAMSSAFLPDSEKEIIKGLIKSGYDGA